jgi:hypothetical protein
MSTESFSLEHIDVMIDLLDKTIAAGTDTPAMLDKLQQALDSIDATQRDAPEFSEYYSRMLEVQALIYGRRSAEAEDEKALQFMKEAVRQAGSVRALRSETLRQYIAQQSKQAAAAQPQPVQQAPVADASSTHASRFHIKLLPTFNNRAKVAVAACFGLVVLSAVAFAVVPQASGMAAVLTKHSQIATEKKLYDSLTAQYKACSSALNQERGTINTNDMAALDAYNQATAKCQTVLQQQNQAARQYDKLIDA